MEQLEYQQKYTKITNWGSQPQLWPKIPVISTYNPIYRMYNPIEITSYN